MGPSVCTKIVLLQPSVATASQARKPTASVLGLAPSERRVSALPAQAVQLEQGPIEGCALKGNRSARWWLCYA